MPSPLRKSEYGPLDYFEDYFLHQGNRTRQDLIRALQAFRSDPSLESNSQAESLFRTYCFIMVLRGWLWFMSERIESIFDASKSSFGERKQATHTVEGLLVNRLDPGGAVLDDFLDTSFEKVSEGEQSIDSFDDNLEEKMHEGFLEIMKDEIDSAPESPIRAMKESLVSRLKRISKSDPSREGLKRRIRFYENLSLSFSLILSQSLDELSQHNLKMLLQRCLIRNCEASPSWNVAYRHDLRSAWVLLLNRARTRFYESSAGTLSFKSITGESQEIILHDLVLTLWGVYKWLWLAVGVGCYMALMIIAAGWPFALAGIIVALLIFGWSALLEILQSLSWILIKVFLFLNLSFIVIGLIIAAKWAAHRLIAFHTRSKK
jgi:hypothetical protein